MKFTCKECGSHDIEVTVYPLEALKPRKDGTDAKTASISEDATLTCEGCGHVAGVKLPELKGQTEVIF